MQERVLKYLFPNFYKEIFTIPSKKYKKLVINSQFGEETVKGFMENIPDEWLEKIMSYDKRFNFHIDSLEFLVYPELQWIKYFKQFPKPEIKTENYLGPYIMSNLISATGHEHSADSWWTERLILELDKLAESLNYQHFIVSTPELNSKYESVMLKCKKSHLLNGQVEDVCDMIGNCRGFVGIDSAWRLISHMFDKPTVTLSKNCQGLGGVPHSHKIRWLPFSESTFAIHHPTTDIVKVLEKMLENDLYKLFPELALTGGVLKNILIKRDYKVNEEKSIL
jgi:hypothetical protein